jgi:hypothetical protein
VTRLETSITEAGFGNAALISLCWTPVKAICRFWCADSVCVI